MNDNVKPDFFIVKAHPRSILAQWIPWAFMEMKDHTAVSLEHLIDDQMSKQAEGLQNRYYIPGGTLWAIACIGSHITFFKYNATYNGHLNILQGFKWIVYPPHATWTKEDYTEFEAFPHIIEGQLIASYNLLNEDHASVIDWYFTQMVNKASK